jgi:hypothetical protein
MKTELDSQEQFLNAFKKLLDDLFQECIMNAMVVHAAQFRLKDEEFKSQMLKEYINHTLDLFLYEFEQIEQHVKDMNKEFEFFNEKDKKWKDH